MYEITDGTCTDVCLQQMLRHDFQDSHVQAAAELSTLWMLQHLGRQCYLHLFWQTHVCWHQSSACCFAEADLALPCQREATERGHQGVAGPASLAPTTLKTTPACKCGGIQ